MTKSDFTKTSTQVERDISRLIDTIERSLDSSNGESERKGQFVLSAFVSVMVVFASILGIEYFVGDTSAEVRNPPVDTQFAAASAIVNERDLRLMALYLDRVQAQSKTIREIKTRVAPSMPIDGHLDAIQNAVADMRGIAGIPSASPPGQVAAK